MKMLMKEADANRVRFGLIAVLRHFGKPCPNLSSPFLTLLTSSIGSFARELLEKITDGNERNTAREQALLVILEHPTSALLITSQYACNM
jgi:hypothetical protein